MMKVQDMIHAIAGIFILVSLVLAQVHSLYWLYFTAFVGLNLFQWSFTHWCLMEKLLLKTGIAKA